MISIYKIKPAFQKLLIPILKKLYEFGITANQITIAAVFLSIGMGISFLYHPTYHFLLLLIPFGYLLRMILNALDGMMALKYNMKSDLGEILNELGDVISDVVIVLPFIILSNVNQIWIILFVLLGIINELAGILAKVISGTRRYDGPMGKSDRAVVIGIFCIVYFFWDGVLNYANWIFATSCFLILISTFYRLKNALK